MEKPVLGKSVRSDWFFLGQPQTILSTNVQESANTKKKTVTDMNTLLRYMEANGMKNELEHLFSNFFFQRTQEKRRRLRASDSFQSSTQYTAILNILKDNEFEKSRKVRAAKPNSLVHEHGKGSLANRKLLKPASTERMPFLKQENSATSIQLRFKELCDGFYPLTLRFPSKRISVKRSVTVFHRSSFYRCKRRIHELVHLPNISW